MTLASGYPQEIVFNEDENNGMLQYAGYPITRFIKNQSETSGGSGTAHPNDVGLARLEGLTIPVGLYTYRYSREIYDTPREQLEVTVIEEPTHQRLLENIAPLKSRHNKTKRANKASKSTQRNMTKNRRQ